MTKFNREERKALQKMRISHAYRSEDFKKLTENILFGAKKDSKKSFLNGFFAASFVFTLIIIYLLYLT